MPAAPDTRQVVVLAPMPIEMHAIVTAFGLDPTDGGNGAEVAPGPVASATRR